MKAFIVIAVCLLLGTAIPSAQAAANTMAKIPTVHHHWTTTQLVTSTVNQAWTLSGKSRAGFREIIRTLAKISLKNRGLTLPHTKTGANKFRDLIVLGCKSDPSNLLYAVVDHAVREVGVKKA